LVRLVSASDGLDSACFALIRLVSAWFGSVRLVSASDGLDSACFGLIRPVSAWFGLVRLLTDLIRLVSV
jgi:hypothetical protein